MKHAKIVKYALCKTEKERLFSDTNIYLEVRDDGAGAFLALSDDRSTIYIDFADIPKILETAKLLKNIWT